MTASKHKAERIDLKAFAATTEVSAPANPDDAAGSAGSGDGGSVAAAKSERTVGRHGYRLGYYGRSLITRVGKLELLAYHRIARDGFRPSCSSAISVRNGHW